MELTGSRTVAAPVEQVWRTLHDPVALKSSIPGCESIVAEGTDAFRVAMLAKVGPVSARFVGKARLSDVDAPRAYSIRFEGSGGVAGFVNGDARITLASDGAGTTTLGYHAKAQVGGKLAQIGSRLIDAAATKVVEDFFTRFVVAAAPQASPAPHGAPAAPRWRRWWLAFTSIFRSAQP
jgi:carbon monoxide dehydrogenase subunit G